jgi:hypothetical protein
MPTLLEAPVNATAPMKSDTINQGKDNVIRPQLDGRWVQSRCEGDMEQLLVDSGLPWAIRRMAKSMNYGVGKTFATISHCYDDIEIVMEMPTRAPTKTAFAVGKPGWQETTGADGKPLLVKALWDGDVLVTERKLPSGKELPVLSRWVNSNTGELFEEVKTSTGGIVLRAFRRDNKNSPEVSKLPAMEKQADMRGKENVALRPSLQGRWVQTRFEGDMEQLLVDNGLPWPIRRMAKSMNYGVGKTFTTISQCDDVMEIVMEMPTKAPTKIEFVVGKPGWQETTGADNQPLLVKASWDGDALVTQRKAPSGKELPDVRRWLEPNTCELVEEIKLSTNGKVLRFFTKQ